MPSLEDPVEVPINTEELHRDLARKFRNVGSKVEAIWQNSTPTQRERIAKRSIVCQGDESLARVRDSWTTISGELIPEYNLRDMASVPDHFLAIFKFRALTPFVDQLHKGLNGRPGDRDFIGNIRARHVAANSEVKDHGKDIFILAPQGSLIMARQLLLLQYLNYIVSDILAVRSKTRTNKAPEKRVNEALVTAASNLHVQPQPLKVSLPEVRTRAMKSKAALEDYLLLLRAEPIVLDVAVNTTFRSRAELVPDDRGHYLPLRTDCHLSAALFESITTAVKTVAIWDYIVCLLRLLDDASDKVERGLIFQELSNTCHLKFRRAQEYFSRMLASRSLFPNLPGEWFQRVTNRTSGQSKITMKVHPADHTISDPQAHYILRLCHPGTSPAAAV